MLHQATARPTWDSRWRIVHPYCFQQNKNTRAARPDGRIPIAGYSRRGFDDNVEAVTELRALEYLALLCEALVRDESQDGRRRKDSGADERLRCVVGPKTRRQSPDLREAATARRSVCSVRWNVRNRPLAKKSVTSVLPVVRRSRNAKPPHLVKQCGAFQAELGGRAAWTSHLPIGPLASSQNLSAYLFLERGV